jgi:FAD/FMN-containing dehydrogenase
MASESLQPVVGRLRDRLKGRLVLPEDADYDQARRVWNAMHDRHPIAVLQAATPGDVQHGIAFARDHALPLAVRGGGHNVAGNGTVDSGLVIDLGSMRSVAVDARARRVRVGGGATLGDLDCATQAEGLAVPTGVVSKTGVAGLTLGGGVGWLTRAYGLSLDNLRSAEVVTADGSLLHADPDQHADLFWGLRGGGGNFGVVTSLEFEGYPLSPEVWAGTVFFRRDAWPDVLAFYEEWTRDLPDELTTIVSFLAPPADWGLPEDLLGETLLLIGFVWAGQDRNRGEEVARPLLKHKASALVAAEPTPWVEVQSAADGLFPKGVRAYWKSLYFEELDASGITTLIEHASRRTSPRAGVDIHHMGGAFARVPEDETAFPNRATRYWLNVYGVWDDPSADAEQIGWVRGLYGAMEPRASQGMYVNFQAAERARDPLELARSAYGPEKLDRLRRVKDRYDPDNVFNLNHNIPPTGRRAS